MEKRQANQEPLIVGVPSSVSFSRQDGNATEFSNPSFYPCSVRIMAIDTVANKIKFNEQTIVKALPSLANIPLVTLYKEELDDFGDHELYKDESGQYRCNTYPIGTIPESANQWVERITNEEGKEVMYLCSDALLWKRQHKEFSKLIEMEEMSVSMEVQITKGKFSIDKVLEVDDFFFTAITVLGENSTPAFHDATIRTFTEQVEYQEMMSELKEYMKQFEGGNGMPQTHFEEEATVETTPQQESEQPKEETKVEEAPKVEEVDYKALYEKLVKESESMEAEYGRTIADMTGEKSSLEQQLQQLQADNEAKIQAMTTELEELRNYKAEIVKVQREAFKNDIIERFGDLQENDEFKELLTQIDNLEPEQVEMRCYAIVGRQARSGKKPKVQTSTRIPVTTPTEKPKNDGYNGLLLKKK